MYSGRRIPVCVGVGVVAGILYSVPAKAADGFNVESITTSTYENTIHLAGCGCPLCSGQSLSTVTTPASAITDTTSGPPSADSSKLLKVDT